MGHRAGKEFGSDGEEAEWTGEFGLYLVGNGEPLKAFEKGSDMIRAVLRWFLGRYKNRIGEKVYTKTIKRIETRVMLVEMEMRGWFGKMFCR